MLDPLHGDGYQLWSGIGGALLVPVAWKTLEWLLPTRCAELNCRSRAVRRHPQHGDPVCEKHLP